jgi:hypothetical protein
LHDGLKLGDKAMPKAELPVIAASAPHEYPFKDQQACREFDRINRRATEAGIIDLATLSPTDSF